MMKVLLLILFLGLTQSFELKCIFKSNSAMHNEKSLKDEKFYVCFFGPYKFSTEEKISSISGNLSRDKTDDDVTGIAAEKSTFKKLPQGFKGIFRNLEIISFAKVGLESLEQSFLTNYPKLRILYIPGNKIESLGKSLFDANLNLEQIFFKDNKIKFVAENNLKPLQKLKFAEFSRNLCISSKGENPDAVGNLILELNFKCFDYFELIRESVLPLEKKLNESESENADLKLKIQSMEAEIEKGRSEIEQGRSEIGRKIVEESLKSVQWKSSIEAEFKQFELDFSKKSSFELDRKTSELKDQLKSVSESQENIESAQFNASLHLNELEESIDSQNSMFNEEKLKIFKIFSETISEIRENLDNISNTIETNKQTGMDSDTVSSISPFNDAQKTDKVSSTNYQIYVLMFLCTLFTISTLIFLVVIITNCKREFSTHDYDLQRFAGTDYS